MRRVATLVAFVVALVPSVARARTQQELPYAPDRVWNAALRLVRVDLNCPLGERDADTGFFLFEYVDGQRHYPGSVELVPTRVENRDGVRVIVQVPAMPSYVERMILDRLQRKLLEDYGQPPRVVRPPPPRDPPQDGQGDEEHPGAPPPPLDDTEPASPRQGSRLLRGEGSRETPRRAPANP